MSKSSKSIPIAAAFTDTKMSLNNGATLKFSFLATAAAACLFWQPDYALALDEDVTKTTASNNPVFVRGHARHTLGCTELTPPKLALVSGPEHGRVCFKSSNVKVQKDLHIGQDNRCLGRLLPGIHVYYEPDNGYAGRDEFKYNVDSGPLTKVGNELVQYRVRITVNANDRNHAAEVRSTTQSERQPSGPIPPCSLFIS